MLGENRVRTVLVVDDDQETLNYTADVVKRFGYEISVTDSAHSALDLCKTNYFDTILSDINMPGMSGLDFLAHVKGREILSPVVFVTGVGIGKKEVTSAIRLGAFDYLEKPWTEADMEKILNMSTEFGMRAKRLADNIGRDADTLSAQEIQQLHSDKKFLALGPAVHNLRRNES